MWRPSTHYMWENSMSSLRKNDFSIRFACNIHLANIYFYKSDIIFFFNIGSHGLIFMFHSLCLLRAFAIHFQCKFTLWSDLHWRECADNYNVDISKRARTYDFTEIHCVWSSMTQIKNSSIIHNYRRRSQSADSWVDFVEQEFHEDEIKDDATFLIFPEECR